MRRWVLSKKDKKKLLKKIKEELPLLDINIVKEGTVEYLTENNIEMILVDSIPAFILLNNRIIPHLKFLLNKGVEWLPVVKVDEGAVGPISRGADLMRPGIVEIKNKFGSGDIVVIIEPRRELPLAVHEALFDSETIIGMKRGKVSKRLHHIGDMFWRLVS